MKDFVAGEGLFMFL